MQMNERFLTGRRIRAEVLGEGAVRKRLDEADSFNREFQELITEYCWGAGWGRTALSRRDRSLMNLGMLSALNRPDEFALHVRAAIGNGISREELKDALIQVGIYCGIPAGVEAFRIASRVLREIDSEKDSDGNR
jgi:4-carboxymuconolactone decarboxylase